MFTYPNQTTVSTRPLAWNKSGVPFAGVDGDIADRNMTAEEALRRAGLLGWNARFTELSSDGDTLADCGIKFPGKRGIIRTNPKDDSRIGLGVVGSQYAIHQNEETVQFLETIVDEGGAHFVAAGYFGEGQRTFVGLKMPEGLNIGGVDAHDFYLFAGNSFDGSGKFTVWTTMLRMTCTNMLTPSFKTAASRWGVRHSGDLKGKVQKARESLQLSWKWAEEFKVGGDWMLSQPFSAGDFRTMVNRLEPPSDSAHAGWIARQEMKRSTLEGLFAEAPTQEIGRGTKWAAYNAFTEYADWFQPIKGADADGHKRADRQLDGANVDAFKQQAWEYLLAA